MLFVNSPRSFYTLRFLLGAAEAGFFPGVIFYLRSWFPPSARAGVVALFMTAGPISGVIGGPLSGALLDWNHRGGLAGWQWMFLIEAIPAVLLGAITMRILPNRPEEAVWLTREEKERLRNVCGKRSRRSSKSGRSPAGNGGRHRRYGDLRWSIWIEYVHVWNQFVVAERVEESFGLAKFAVGVFIGGAVPGGGDSNGVDWGAFGSKWGAAVARRAAGVCGCGGFADRWIVYCGRSECGGIFHRARGFFVDVGADVGDGFRLIGGAAAARGIALINSIGNLGSGFGPYWIGYLRQVTGGFRAGLFSVAFLITMAGILC